VSSSGVVTGLGAGTATITATSEGKSGGTPLTVTVNPVATVTVTLANASLTQGSTTQAVATVRDAAGNPLAGRTITWTSAALGVATVTTGGAVTAVGAGSVLITATVTAEGKSGSATLTVSSVPVASVTVSMGRPRIGVGQISQGWAVLRDAGGNVLSGRVVTWTPSDPAVATVTNTGVATAVGLGTAILTATSEGVSGSATIAVTAMYALTALSQTSAPNTAVIQAPGVKVTDGGGAPVPGVSVAFTVSGGGGSVSHRSVVTDGNGVALLTSWTFGPSGPQSVTASSSSAPDVIFSGLSRPAGGPGSGYDVTLLFKTPMSTENLRAFVNAKERIQELVIGDVADVDVNLSVLEMRGCGGVAIQQRVDDVIVVVDVSPIDGVGNILGQAGACYGRSGSPGLPSVGHMQFDSADLADLESRGLLEAVVLHEMMHVLGFGTLWPDSGYLAGGTGTMPYFTGPGAVSAFDTYNGGTTYPDSKVPVEGTGGAGTMYSHWRESDLDDELMTGYLDSRVPNPFSATTLASMADLGYVVAPLTSADPFRWGAATVALRAALQGADTRIHMVDDVRREPMRILGPDGRPLFP
jgi:uncharacterized protein YjdB